LQNKQLRHATDSRQMLARILFQAYYEMSIYDKQTNKRTHKQKSEHGLTITHNI